MSFASLWPVVDSGADPPIDWMHLKNGGNFAQNASFLLKIWKKISQTLHVLDPVTGDNVDSQNVDNGNGESPNVESVTHTQSIVLVFLVYCTCVLMEVVTNQKGGRTLLLDGFAAKNALRGR